LVYFVSSLRILSARDITQTYWKTPFIFMPFDSSADELEQQLCNVHCSNVLILQNSRYCRIVEGNFLSNIFELRGKEKPLRSKSLDFSSSFQFRLDFGFRSATALRQKAVA